MSLRFRWELPYRSRRMPVMGHDVVATSQPLAVSAGMEMYALGGNAVDAALAAAMALTVVEPTGNGIGSDAFAFVHDGEELHALNASGRSPRNLDAERLLEEEAMPWFGWDTVTVPGAVSAWIELNERFGRLDLVDLAAPAVRYARHGFAVSVLVAEGWGRAAEVYGEREDWRAAFTVGDGMLPPPGVAWRTPPMAETLEEIAHTGGVSFYMGRIAERIAEHAASQGGALDDEDLALHTPEWVEPLTARIDDVTVHELPPNGQGIAALIALEVLQRAGGPGRSATDPDGVHRSIEAMKLAFDETHTHVADPRAMTLAPADLLEPGRLDGLAARIDPERARPRGEVPTSDGTVYLATGDRDGMMVSYIQSNYVGFGSGIVVPGGISLHNRGAGFVTDPGHPNVVAPRKRPFHTIIPGFATWDDGSRLAFGVMGGPMQPQGHLQVLTRIVAHRENPQAAIDAPRWRLDRGAIGALGPGGRDSEQPWELALEEGFDAHLIEDLHHRDHRIRHEPRWSGAFGGAQAVLALPGGAHLAASDPRKDGHAAAR